MVVVVVAVTVEVFDEAAVVVAAVVVVAGVESPPSEYCFADWSQVYRLQLRTWTKLERKSLEWQV